jgi:hypothetical protein
MFSFLPSLIEVSRAVWCGVPLEMKEGTIPIWGTKGLSTRPRCITLLITLTNALNEYSKDFHFISPIGCVMFFTVSTRIFRLNFGYLYW